MAQMWQYVCHFLKPETNRGDFRLYFVLVEKDASEKKLLFDKSFLYGF